MVQSYIPSGLGETCGFVAETTVGTFVTPTRWVPHKSATFNLKKITATSEALQGSRFKQADRRVLVAKEVTGSLEYELADSQFGVLLAHAIGSSAVPIADALSTTVAADSNAGEISTVASWSAPSAGVLAVASIADANPNGGTFTVATSSTLATCTYTGVGTGKLTGVAYVSGSATGTVATGGAVTFTTGEVAVQNHIPNFLEAQSLSFQKGVPFTTGQSIQAFSYNGVKIVDWTIACAVGGIATLSLTVDAWAEATATSYTAATYQSGASAPNLLNWGAGSLLTGGTVTTASSVVSVSGGGAPTGLIKSFSVKGTNVLATDRFGLGSQTKAEQLTNGFSEITGEIEIEFATLADAYTAFAADTQVTLQITLLGPVVQGSDQTGLTITIPSVRLEGETPNASGAGIISVKVPFTALVDSAGDPIIQLSYSSFDSTV
jgi:hypothetical protein